MKQTAYEIQQYTEELMHEAVGIWQQSDYGQSMEELQNDPVIKLLVSVIATQAKQFGVESEHIFQEIEDEFTRCLYPAEMGNAIPATAVIETSLTESIPAMKVNESTTFTLKDTKHSFIPLLETTAYNLHIHSITRIDGRRWKVCIKSPFPITKLTDLSFAIKGTHYQSLSVSIKGKPLPLVKPWQYADFPFNKCFTLDNMVYNGERVFNASSIGMDLFARQNVRLYCIGKCELQDWLPRESDLIECVFEFQGITNDFIFDKSQMALNVIVLVNAQVRSATLTSESPITRIDESGFMNLIRPAEEQMFGDVRIDIRKVVADRFNRGSLLKLLQCLIDKCDTDYYAFADIKDYDNTINQLRSSLRKLQSLARDTNGSRGIYLLLHKKNKETNVTLDVQYLSTAGAEVNSQLTKESVFQGDLGFDNSRVAQIASPVPGFDEIVDETQRALLTKYQMTTQNRIVTPADIKQFCLYELMIRYHISREFIKAIRIEQRLCKDSNCGYAICVEIVIANNLSLVRGFGEMIPQVEILLSKTIAVRSANVYPVNINILWENPQS